MKFKLLTISLILGHTILLAQSIVWNENQLDGSNKPFYFGGFNRISTEFADIDGDNDLDCFIGTGDGNIAFFENINTSSSPSWKLVTLKYADIDLLTLDRIKVCFVDIDNDSDLDMFIGGNSSPLNFSPLIFYKNIGTKFSPEWKLVPEFLNNIEEGEISKYCCPAFVDIDNDNDYDLIYGNYKGYCIYYENIGDAYTYNFVKKSSNYFDLPRFSNCPNIEFYDLDGDLVLDAFVGTQYELAFIKNTGTPVSASWEKVTANYLGINKYNCGTYFSPTLTDLDKNNQPELYVGTGDGQLWNYESIGNRWVKNNEIFFDEGNNLNPEFADLNGDSKEELYIPKYKGFTDKSYVEIFRNTGSMDSVVWGLIPDTLLIDLPYPINRITFADIDSDNDLDLIAGFKDFNQNILLYKNIGTHNTPVFDNNYEIIAQFREGQLVDFYPLVVDYDNDSDLDMIISAQDGTTNSYGWVDFFENTGNATSYKWEYSFTQELHLGSVECTDYDNDNDLDLLFAFASQISIFNNVGNKYEPKFDKWDVKKIVFQDSWVKGMAQINLNNDNFKDLVIGTANGGLMRLDNNGFTDSFKTLSEASIIIYPSPAFEYISISGLDLGTSKYYFFIYSQVGQLIGKYEIENKTISLPSLKNGLYVYKLQLDKTLIKTGKLIIHK